MEKIYKASHVVKNSSKTLAQITKNAIATGKNNNNQLQTSVKLKFTQGKF